MPQKIINLGLNDGTYCSQRVIDALATYSTNTALRNYPSAENKELREAIARLCGCKPEMIYPAAGSGPILKQAVPLIIKQKIMASPMRVLKHLVSKSGYPLITASFTYYKVPLKAMAQGLTVRLIPLVKERGYTLTGDDIRAELNKGDGFVYLANPNNPTGNVIIRREELEPVIREYPESTFWIDEAYIEYCDPAEHKPMVDLVSAYPNVVCSRTFSFAHGLAALKVGYLVAPQAIVSALEGGVTDYRIPALCEHLCVEALADGQHLEFIRRTCAEARAYLSKRMEKHPMIRVFPSTTNFVLCEFTDGRDAKAFAAKVLEAGFRIKTFVPVGDLRYDAFFRITIGTPEENAALMDVFDSVLGG